MLTYRINHQVINASGTFHTTSLKIVLPFKAVTLLSSSISVRLEPERSLGLAALSRTDLGAERGRSLQLRSHQLGVMAVVAGPRAVRRRVAEKL